MSSSNLESPFAQAHAPAPLGNNEVVQRFASEYVNYMALEQQLHSGTDIVEGVVSSSGGSFVSCISQNSNSSSQYSNNSHTLRFEELENLGTPQFILTLKEELVKLNAIIASNLDKLWSRILILAQDLPPLEDAHNVPHCQQLVQEGKVRCDEIGAELGDIYTFFHQNIKICGDLLEASAHSCSNDNKQELQSDYYQIIKDIVCKNIYFEPVLSGIADIYMHIRNVIQGGDEDDHNEAVELDQIQRVTHKFWVHQRDVMNVKVAIAAHLPLLQLDQQMHLNFGADAHSTNPVLIQQAASGMPASTQISSVYLDCNKLQSYHMRIADQDATAVNRIRWYGKRDPNSPIQKLFIERKMHRNDWTGAISIKDRAAILQCNIINFLQGKNNQNMPEMLRRDASADLLREVQDEIVERNQRPVLRSLFDRTAFQKQGDSSVRVTLDSNILMIKENLKKSWCRNLDAEKISPKEIAKFEYCVMEVKLQSEAPEWLRKIIQKSEITALPPSYARTPEIVPAMGFSKFLHGIAFLYPNQIEELPYWIQSQSNRVFTLNLDQMSRRSNFSPEEESSQNPKIFEQQEDQEKHVVDFTPITNNNTNKIENYFQIEQLTQEQQQLSSSSSSFASKWEKNTSNGKNSNKLDNFPLPTTIQEVGGVKGKPQPLMPTPTPIPTPTPNSKVLIRTRVEPKVFFANERTFLSWLTVAILLVFAALSLINQHILTMGSQGGEGGMLRRCQKLGHTEIQCEAGLISGALMAPVGIILVGYALYMYRKRTFQILGRSTARYDDQLGPIVLSFMLICVMMLSYALSIVAAL